MKPVFVLLGVAALLVAQEGPALVEVAAVESRMIATTRSFTGTVEAVRTSDVDGEVEGRVVEFLARQGRRVAEDEPLARLRSTRVDIRLRGARAELKLRQTELAELENGARKEEVEASRARLGQAEAAVDVRRWKLENARKLVASATISPDALRDAELDARVAEQVMREARATLKLVEAGPRAERIEQARARVAIQQAAVDALVDEKERHVIRAPFAGYVLVEHTEKGQWLAQGDPVARIASIDEVDVVVPVLEDYVPGLTVGQKVDVRFDALRGRELPAKVHAIVPQADRRARTFPVKLRMTNPAHGASRLLRIGMFARLDLAVGEKTKALLVPKDALVLGGPSPIVFVVEGDKEKTARPVPVQTGRALDDRIEIVSGLTAGQAVVTKGNERLRPGQTVRTAK